MGLANKGWMRGEPQDGGWIGWMIKPLGRWSLIMEIDEGFAVGMSPAELSAEQLLSKLWLWEGKAESYGWGVIQHRKRSSPYSMPSPPANSLTILKPCLNKERAWTRNYRGWRITPKWN